MTLHGTAVAYRADATVQDLDLQEVGHAFNVPALDDPKYRSVINAHVTADGAGTDLQAMNLNASGTISDSSLMGGRIPALDFDATVADDAAHITARGSFADLNPAVASGRQEMDGNVAGSVDAEATITALSAGLQPDSVNGTARLTVEPSTVGGLAIQSASVDADYHDQTGDIRTLEVVGRDLNVTARGTLALNDSGQSNLTLHADSPRLEEIGKLFDIPVSGIAKVDGTITGNRLELQARGTLSADGLKYEDNGALSVDSSYTVKVPDLAFERAAVEADTKATFVTVAGQNINEVQAKTSYADRTVTFDATATQPERSLDASGSLLLHPDHQEVHLTALNLTAGQQHWTIASGSQPTVNYASGAVAVENLRLRNGDQEIGAEGRFGQPGDALNVSLTNIDLAGVDALLLREPQFSGRLNASGTVTGTKDAPQVNGRFDVNQGGFRQFRYDTLGGTVSFESAGLTLDTRLQQNASQWITAKGYLPASLFSSSKPGSEASAGGHVEPATPAETRRPDDRKQPSRPGPHPGLHDRRQGRAWHRSRRTCT